MFAKLSALVSSAPSFPYQIGEPYRTAWGGWKHFKGKSNSDGSAVSIFRTSSTNKQDPKLTSARNGLKRLRTVSIHAQLVSKSDLKLSRICVAVAAPECAVVQRHS